MVFYKWYMRYGSWSELMRCVRKSFDIKIMRSLNQLTHANCHRCWRNAIWPQFFFSAIFVIVYVATSIQLKQLVFGGVRVFDWAVPGSHRNCKTLLEFAIEYQISRMRAWNCCWQLRSIQFEPIYWKKICSCCAVNAARSLSINKLVRKYLSKQMSRH